MLIITKIKPQKNKKRVNVYLDGRFSFGLDLENFMKLGLKVGQEYSEEEVNEIIKKAEFQKTYDKLLRFATLRPRSKKEVNTWFVKHKVHDSIHDSLFNRLKRLDLIDDEKFAKWWVEQRLSFRPRGKRILNYELRIKGIDRDIIEKVVSEVEIDEAKIAKELLEKKLYRWKNLEKFKARKKMSDFLARKGFEWDVIKNAIDVATKKK